MLVGTNLKEIKYVAVEVIRRTAIKAADIECGLFMGVCSRQDCNNKEHTFIALQVTKDSVRMYNAAEYKIVTVDLVSESTRYMTVFTHEIIDQIEGLTLLRELTMALEKEGKTYKNDPNKALIDVDLYKDYPEVILTGNNITQENKTTETKDTDSSSIYSAGNRVDYTNIQNKFTTVVKDPVVAIMKRKGRLPSVETLEKMKDLVKLIAKGEFTTKQIPIPECDRSTPLKKEEIPKATTRMGFL